MRQEPMGADEAEALKPLAGLARAVAGAPVHAPDEAEFTALRAAMDRARGRARARRIAGGALLLVALGFGGRQLWLGGRGAPIGYVVDGAVAGVDGFIPRVQAASAKLAFSDGTVVTLAHKSRARVVSTSAEGAALRLEDGRAHFAVVHRPRARWSVEAGPFVVQVTGTTFDVSWSPAGDVLRVRLLAGAVSVN